MTVLKLNGLTKKYSKALVGSPNYNILVLNLMPTKADTENQISELFSELKTTVAVTFLYPKSHQWKNGNQRELSQHYETLDSIREKHFDGLIVTGAPVEKIDFQKVDYWKEFLEIRRWSKTHTTEQLFTCWGAQAALYVDFKIPKVNISKKIFGVYANQIPTTGLTDDFLMPQSRFSKVRTTDVDKIADLDILASNDCTGPFFMQNRKYHSLYIMGHPEYQANTLVDEYYRDLNSQHPVEKPINIPLTDPTKIYHRWHDSSLKLYQRWLEQIQTDKDKLKQRQLQI